MIIEIILINTKYMDSVYTTSEISVVSIRQKFFSLKLCVLGLFCNYYVCLETVVAMILYLSFSLSMRKVKALSLRTRSTATHLQVFGLQLEAALSLGETEFTVANR